VSAWRALIPRLIARLKSNSAGWVNIQSAPTLQLAARPAAQARYSQDLLSRRIQQIRAVIFGGAVIFDGIIYT